MSHHVVHCAAQFRLRANIARREPTVYPSDAAVACVAKAS